MNLHRLKLRARALLAPRRVERDLDQELAFHIDRETQKHIANGSSPAEARTRAMARFGSLTVAADECRDARGTALLDSLVRDVRYACRSFRRTPLVALTIVTTVGLGLGLVAVVFTLLNACVFRVDEVRNPHELFAVERQRSANAEPESFTRAQYEALVRETGVFSDAFAKTPDIDAWIDGRRMEGPLVTGNFFHVLGVSAARGRTLTPSDDEPGGRPAIVLSHRAWSRHFASDPGVLSRTVRVNGSAVPRCRRDAGRLSRTHGRGAGLLGAALAPWPVPPRPERTRRRRRPQHRRAAEARCVARPGARAAPRVGLAACREHRRAACG